MRHWARRHRTGVLLGTIAVFALADGRAFAQGSTPNHPPTATAREAYDEGLSLAARKQFAAAARQFALADQLSPSDSVLADALDQSVTADDVAFGSMLVARAARSPQNVGSPQHVELQRAAAKAREKFRGRAGRVELRCAGDCTTEVDGKPLEAASAGWLSAGPHVVAFSTATYPGYRDEHRVDISSTDTPVVTFRPPAKAPTALEPEAESAQGPQHSPADRERHGLAPTWFWIGAGVTAVVAGGAIISGLDASHSHKDFEDHGCVQQGSSDCTQRADDGKSGVLRTNILIGGAAVAGVATAVVGLFLVDWKPRHDGVAVRASFSAGPGDARAVVTGSF